MDARAAAKRAKPSAIPRALGLLLGSVLLIVICVVLLAPPMLALVGGIWAAVTEVRVIAAIWMLARHQDYTAAFARLATLDAASRIAFLGVSFFALLFALMLLMAGLLGRRWARLFVAPGLLFTLPALLCYAVAWVWLAPVAARIGVGPLAQTSAAAYALLDAVVLAAALCDMRPTLRRARRVARLGKRTHPSIPAVRAADTGARAGARAAADEPMSGAVSPDDPLDARDEGDWPQAYPPPAFALQAPITRPLAAVRIEDVAQARATAGAVEERDEFADSAEAETWRIFSGEWAAWGANDMALRQEVTLPPLGWPAGDDEAPATDVASAPTEMAPTTSAIERAVEGDVAQVAGTADLIGATPRPQDALIATVTDPEYAGMAPPVYDEVVVESAPERMTLSDDTLVAPPPVYSPNTETVAFGLLVISNEAPECEAPEQVGAQAAPDTPLGLVPV